MFYWTCISIGLCNENQIDAQFNLSVFRQSTPTYFGHILAHHQEVLLTHSMVQSPSWEANWFAASQEIPRISRNRKVHYRTNKRPPPVSILQMWMCMWMFLNISVLEGGVVSNSPNPQAGEPPLVGCPRLLIQFIRSYPPYRRLFLSPQPEDAPCRGDRDPLHGIIREVYCIYTTIGICCAFYLSVCWPANR